MELPKRIGLKPHHIDILVKQFGDEYKNWERGEDFLFANEYDKRVISKMANFFRALSKSPNTEIEVVHTSRKDYICGSLCDNLIDGKCGFGESEDGGFNDLFACMRYNISLGNIRIVKKFLSFYIPNNKPAE